MRIHPNLFAYLNGEPSVNSDTILSGSDRPVIVLDPEEHIISSTRKSLIPITEEVYELAIPHIQLLDWEKYEELKTEIFLSTKSGITEIKITDQVLDSELAPEEKQEELKLALGSKFDRNTGDVIGYFVGIFNKIAEHTRSRQVNAPMVTIYEKLESLSRQNARLPLVIFLEKKYQLKRKLELIAPKLRSQLRRQAELMPIGRIQEMDSYCLRDYTRRPGKDAIEKAGARQMLMGIQRYQDFNTPENRFLVGFMDLLHLDCLTYKHYSEAMKFGLSIDRFRQEPDVQSIQKQRNLLDKPNYVLQQNPIYRSFYEACLEFVKRRNEKDNIWGDRHYLAIDAVGILIISAILQFQGVFVSPTAKIETLAIAKYGEYIENKVIEPITCFTQSHVYKFSLSKSSHKSSDIKCDWLLGIDVQDLQSLEFYHYALPIWMFWSCPSPSCLASAQMYTNELKNIDYGVLIYVQNDVEVIDSDEFNNLKILCLPDLMDSNNNGLLSCVDFMASFIIEITNELSRGETNAKI